MTFASKMQVRVGFAKSIVQPFTPTVHAHICPLLPSGEPLKVPQFCQVALAFNSFFT